MGKRSNHGQEQLVPHPRFGVEPLVSGLNIPRKAIEEGHWSYKYEAIFPESVLVADTATQNYSIYPRKYYVDMLERCEACKRPFIFFAREQKYWFETLRFYVDARCIHCPECRRDTQWIRRRLKRYSDLSAKSIKSEDELKQLINDGTYLLRRGVLRNLGRLGHLKNEGIKRIPDYPGTKHLVETLSRVRLLGANEP